jgi:hypothetical protein
MHDSFEEIACAVGGAFVSSRLGTAELLVALLVAVAFALSAVQTFLFRDRNKDDWRERRF